jgi:hypothetical protein
MTMPAVHCRHDIGVHSCSAYLSIDTGNDHGAALRLLTVS